MAKNQYPSVCWLTVNRACNLRCKWCYAKDINYKRTDEMSLQNAFHIVDLISKSNIKQLIIIGGEPTCYRHLFEVIDYARKKRIETTLVTNGVLLSDLKYIKALEENGLSSVGLSLKGYSKESFKEITKVDKYYEVLQAIKNLSKSSLKFSVSFVLSEDNIDNFTLGVNDAVNSGAEFISLSFEFDFSNIFGANKYVFDRARSPFKYIEKFVESYEELNKLTKGQFTLEQGFPLCLWDKDFIARLEKRNQICSVCQLLKRYGLIFDTNLNIIPCNAMYKLPIGKLYESFSDEKELLKFWNCSELRAFFKRVKAVPSEECLDCELYPKCGGGCIAQWFNYSFEDLMKYKKEYYNVS